MSTRNRTAHRDYVHRSHLASEARQEPQKMSEYYHNSGIPNGGDSSEDEMYYKSKIENRLRGDKSQASFRVAVTLKKDFEKPKIWEVANTNVRMDDDPTLPSGQFRATMIKVEYPESEVASENGEGGIKRVQNDRPNYSKRSGDRGDYSTSQSLRQVREDTSNYRREVSQPEKSSQRSQGAHPRRRHNTSPDHKYFVSAIGVLNQGSTAKTSALTTENLRKFENDDRIRERQQLIRRSMSNSSLDRVRNETFVGREFGSTSSIDMHSVRSIGGESFFQMVHDFRTETDQRSPAPPHFDKLLQGNLSNGGSLDRHTKPPPSSLSRDNYSKEEMRLKNVVQKREDSPKLHRRMPSKREKKNRSKSVSGGEVSLLRRLRSTKGDGGGKTPDEKNLEDDLEARIEEGVRRRAFMHYDVQSTFFDLQEIIRIMQNPERKASTLTGASAASRAAITNTPNGSIEDLIGEEQDSGDGRSNELLLSCPFFRNELSEEVEPRVSLSKMGTLNTKVMRKFKQKVVLEKIDAGRGPQDTDGYRGPVVELVDQGARYYRNFFLEHDHQNFFGIDDALGPVAVSLRREKVESPENPPTDNGKDASIRYLYRIIARTCELNTLRGSVMEDSIPSAAKHNTSRGLPLKDVLEYVIPDLPHSSLRHATNTEKTKEQLCKLDEQGLSNKYKVGIMFCKAGQNTEEEMYNNEHASPAFDEFLECLGEKVKLKGFVKYRAQLDTKTDSTGTHALYALYQENEVMFHVSTMLPYTATNRQQLLRKRHIGNDIVTLVFQEPDALPFTPKSVRSQFQHVFIVVRVHEPLTSNVYYSVAVSRSKGVPLFGPPLPTDAVFTKCPEFAKFLLAKIINAENAVHKSEKFVSMATRTRKEYLKDLATNHVTNTQIDSGTKFSLFNKKKEKTCPSPAPDFKAKGALVWDIQVYLWAPLATDSKFKLEDFSLSDPVNCHLAISPDLLVLIKAETKETLFSIPCKAIIGWTPHSHSLKLYFNEGNCIRLRIPDNELDEIPEIVKRLEAITSGTRTQEITLRRNGLGQLGFHVHYQGIVVEVDPYGYTWQAGLRKGARLVEICEVAVCTQTHEEMIDLLRTSMTVKVSVVPPFADGSPRRGTTPMEYLGKGEDIHTMRPAFHRSVSGGRGSKNQLPPVPSRGHREEGHHVRSMTSPASSSSTNYPYPPTVSDDGLPNPGNVRSAIQTFERKFSIDSLEEVTDGRYQRKHRDASNYWKNLKSDTSASGQHLPEGRSREDDESLLRLADGRRSARDLRSKVRRPQDLPLKLRSSQDDLDQVTSEGHHSRDGSLDDDYRVRSYTDHKSRSTPRRDKSAYSSYHQSKGSGSSQSAQQFIASTPQYKRNNVAQATIRTTGSRDRLHSNNSNDNKWYDLGDEYDGYNDRGVSVAKDSLPDSYIIPSSSSKTMSSLSRDQSLGKDQSLYDKAERYSPSEHLYQSRSLDYELMRPSVTTPSRSENPPVPYHSAQSSSNISDLSTATHSTQSSGSSHKDYDSLKSRTGSLKQIHSPSRSPRPTQSQETRGKRTPSPVAIARKSPTHGSLKKRTSSPSVGVGVSRRTPSPTGTPKDYGHQKRIGPSNSSNSSFSDTSPRNSSRRLVETGNSSNESLNSRLRPGVTTTVIINPNQIPGDNRVQDDLRKLIAPEEMERMHRGRSEWSRNARESPTTNTVGGGGPSSTSLAKYRVNLPESMARPPPHPSRSNLNRTLSDESLVAGGSPKKGAYSKDGSKDVIFTSTQSSTLPGKMMAETANIRGSNYSRLTINESTPNLSSTFPLPDSTTTTLDWKNLVETAKHFEGYDTQAFKSASADTLNEINDNTPTMNSLSTLNQVPDRRISKSSSSISSATGQHHNRGRSLSDQDKDEDSAYEEEAAANHHKSKTKEELEAELQKLNHQLQQERQFKDSMQNQMMQLLHHNKQLQNESESTSDQLRQFTEWFFSAIDNKN